MVCTTLNNVVTPLIRYELGDLAQVGGLCPCGRGLPVLTAIKGRVRNMVTLPTGEQLFPSFRRRGLGDDADSPNSDGAEDPAADRGRAGHAAPADRRRGGRPAGALE